VFPCVFRWYSRDDHGLSLIFIATGHRLWLACTPFLEIMMTTRLRIWLALGLALVACPLLAQVSAYEEYGTHLHAAQEVTPLTSTLFGDQVSLYNGSTAFDVTDIDLPGNSSLPAHFGRRMSVHDRRLYTGNLGGLGDWDVLVPSLDGTFVKRRYRTSLLHISHRGRASNRLQVS
jgi:hypothetical protein